MDPNIVNTIIAVLGFLFGAWGVLRSWLTERKMAQIETEKLAIRLNITFSYRLERMPTGHFCYGQITWHNLGMTNVKLISLNVDLHDRTKEMTESFCAEQGDQGKISQNTPPIIPNRIKYLDIVGVNNHKFLNYSCNSAKGSWQIYHKDPIYGLELKGKEMQEMRKLHPEVIPESFEMKYAIKHYLNQFIEKSTSLMQDPSALQDYFFRETMAKNIRGFQLFPGEERTQEFILRFEGDGVLYLNVESAAIRMTQKNINAEEEFKNAVSEILDMHDFSPKKQQQLVKTLRTMIKPASLDRHKQKANFLIHLTN